MGQKTKSIERIAILNLNRFIGSKNMHFAIISFE